MTFRRTTSPGYLINHLARLFAAKLQTRIKPLGLSTGTFPIMLQLWEQDGQTQRDLVEALGIEQATVANSLNRMERDGLITRRPDDHDGRVKRIWLSQLGLDLHGPATAAAQSVNDQALDCLDPAERAMYLRLTTKLISHFKGAT